MFCKVNILLLSSLLNIVTASVSRWIGDRWVGGRWVSGRWSVGRWVGSWWERVLRKPLTKRCVLKKTILEQCCSTLTFFSKSFGIMDRRVNFTKYLGLKSATVLENKLLYRYLSRIFNISEKHLFQRTAFAGCFNIKALSSYSFKVILLSQKMLWKRRK